MYFNYWQSTANYNWYWNLKSSNHEIIAQGEGYTSKQACLNAIALVIATSTLTPIYLR